jgi:DNA-binding Lrp family transcriptional regulator
MSGAYDFLVVVEGKTLKDVAFFVSEKLSVQENVKSTATHFLLKTFKENGTIIDSFEEIERLAVIP